MKRLPVGDVMRHYLAASVSCGVVITSSAIACSVLLAHVLAGLLSDASSRTLAHWAPTLWIIVAVWSIRVLAHWMQARLSQRGATAAIADLNGRLLRAVTALPPRELASRKDDAAVLLTRGLDGLRPYFTRYLPAAIQAAVLTPVAIVVVAIYDLQAAVIVLIALPLVPLFMALIGLVTADRSAASLVAMTTLQSRLLDLISGIPTLRALGRAKGPERRISELAEAHRRSTMATLRIAFLSALVLELLATLGVALVAVSVGLRLVYGEVSLAAALTVLLLAPEVFWPLRRVGAEFHAAQDGRAAADKALALLDSAATDPRGTRRPADYSIRLDAISVDSRSGAAPQRLSADLRPGTVTVFTGPNGAGKSTALHVILGLVQPTSGRALIGGVDVAELDAAAWWSRVAWLPSRSALVPGTVRDNLELFGPLDDLDTACRRACFDQVLLTLPAGLDTVVGRDGTGLSLGQRQRLGLARVLGSAKPVLLLDEPTSHLDAEAEARVLAAIRGIADAGATVVVVGHRAPILAIGDRVVEVLGENAFGASLVSP